MQAKLNKDGRTVKCGKPRCGGDIAWVLERAGERIVWFAPGWVWLRDGTWVFSARAQRRVKHGHSPQARAKSHNIELEPQFIMGLAPRRLPVLARCRRCAWQQWLDAQRLDVVPEFRYGKEICAAPRCPELTNAGICAVHAGILEYAPLPYRLLRLEGNAEMARWKRYLKRFSGAA